MGGGIFKLVFILSIKDDTILINEAHYGSLPPGRSEEIDNYIEKPLLYR